MPTATRFALYLLFAVSGACGLVYESIWSHYLRNYLGHAAHGQTVVLVIFVGGLALGAWLAARRTERLDDPLVAYAAAEIAIGLAALAFHPVFVAFTGWSYDTLLPATCGASGWCATQWLTAALLIAPPAIALGATFPWMVAGVLRRYPQSPGHEISVLYFLNSLGAVVGVLASAFVLIAHYGLPGTLRIAGALNLVIGAMVFVLARSGRARAVRAEAMPPGVQPATPARKSAKRGRAQAIVEPPGAAPVPRPSGLSPRAMLVVAALTGLSSFIYEIVWIRMLALVLGASTHAFELMLAAFILGLALGGAWIRNRIDRIADTPAFLGYVQLAMAVAAVATLPLYGRTFDALSWLLGGVARSDAGYALYQLGSGAIALAVMLPATFLAGMTLPLVTHRMLAMQTGERAVGLVYGANTAGAIVGVVAAVHVLVPLLGLKGALLAGVAIDLALGVYLLRKPRGEVLFSAPAFATVIAALGVFGVVAGGVTLDPRRMAAGVFRDGTTRLPDEAPIVYHADGKTATVSVIEGGGRRIIRTNGKPDASMAMPGHPPTADEPTQALLGALAVGAHPDAKRAAVIGMGSGTTSTVLLASPTLQRVDTIEIERKMVEGAKAFAPRNGPVYSDERSHFVFDDAKAWLARVDIPYDIVISEPSNPWVSGVASLFTEETYARVAKSLAPGGVFVQWIQLYEIDGALLSSMFRALVRHFPHYMVYKGGPGDLIVVASRDRRPSVDAGALFGRRGIASLLVATGVPSAADIDSRWRGDETSVNAVLAAFDAPVNSDYRPYVDTHASRARFLHANAQPIFEANLAPAAMLEVMGSAPARAKGDTPLALALADALVAPAAASVALPPAYAGYADAIRATRELLRTCKPQGPLPVLLEGAVGTAIVINDQLTRQRAGEVWSALRSGACYRTLAPEVAVWVDLFAAVAARDAAAMSEPAMRALASAPNAFTRDYALAAVATAEIAQGRGEVAGRLLEMNAPRDPQAWLVMLREAAAKRSIR